MAGMKEAEEGIAREKIRDIKDIKIIVNLIVKASILDQLFFFFFWRDGRLLEDFKQRNHLYCLQNRIKSRNLKSS